MREAKPSSDKNEYPPVPAETERVAKLMLDAAFIVHSALGPGLLESVYETCLAHEIQKKGIDVQVQVPLPVFYEDLRIENGTGLICLLLIEWLWRLSQSAR